MLKQVFACFIALMAIFVMSCDETPAGADDILATPVISITPDTSQLTVSWAAIAEATSYNVYWATTAGVTTSSNVFSNITATQCIHSGLANGVTIYYRVSAEGDNILPSPLSEEKSGTPISTVIEPPQNFAAVPGDEIVSLSWSVSTGANRYTIYWDTTTGVTEQSNTIDSITSLAHTHSGLTNGKAYFYRIAAKDAAGGSSALSNEVSSTPLNPVPAPENLTATPGDAFITLSIDPYSGGKNPIFRIYWATTAGVTSSSDTVVDPTGKGISFPHTVTGLTNGTAYFYRASAIDSSTGKESDLSNEAGATPSDTIPIGVPQGVTATKGNAQVTLSWKAVVGASTYNIYWATDSGVTTSSDSISGISKFPYTHTGLTNFTTYYYRVNAQDTSGKTSDLSVEVNATPDTSVSDLAPKNVVATPGTGQIIITWDPVTGADGYNVYGGTDPVIDLKNPIASGITSTTYTHTGLTSGTTYYYKVASVFGKDVYLSNMVSAIPSK